MRSRETVTGSFGTVETWYHTIRSNCSDPFGPNGSDLSYTGSVTTKRITDCVTPRFLSLVKEGRPLPLNPVEIVTATETRTAGSGEHLTQQGSTCWLQRHHGSSWWLRPWLVELPAFDSSIVDLVTTDAVAKAKESIWDASTDALQLSQTARLLGGTWTRVNSFALRAAERAQAVKRSARALAFAKHWLEYRYGWMPLLYSAEDAMLAFNSTLEKGNLRRAYSSVPAALNLSASDIWSQDSGQGTGVESHTLTGERIYRGFALSEVDNGSVRWGSDPITSAWELLPYSFVADWFFNIGTWLQATTPFSGATIVGSAASVKDTYELRQDFNLAWSGANHAGSFGTVSTVIQVEQYTRFANAVSSLPQWNPRLTPLRILDLAALVLSGSRRVRKLLDN